MDMEKLMEYIDLTKKNQHENFWSQFFQNIYSSPADDVKKTQSFFSQQEMFPRCDMYEYENTLIIEAELAGVHKSDIQVYMQNNTVIIKGQCKTLKPQIQYYLKERQNRTFEKKIALPVIINNKGIRTSFQDGILTISLPKIAHEESVPIQVDSL